MAGRPAKQHGGQVFYAETRTKNLNRILAFDINSERFQVNEKNSAKADFHAIKALLYIPTAYHLIPVEHHPHFLRLVYPLS
jgi:hypothetical protein